MYGGRLQNFPFRDLCFKPLYHGSENSPFSIKIETSNVEERVPCLEVLRRTNFIQL